MRQPRKPRQPRGVSVPSDRYRVVSVAPTGDWPVTAMVSVEVSGFGIVHAFCIEEELGRPTLGVLTRYIERPGGGERNISMVDFESRRVKRQLEFEALAALAALTGPTQNSHLGSDPCANGRESAV